SRLLEQVEPVVAAHRVRTQPDANTGRTECHDGRDAVAELGVGDGAVGDGATGRRDGLDVAFVEVYAVDEQRITLEHTKALEEIDRGPRSWRSRDPAGVQAGREVTFTEDDEVPLRR